MSRDGEILPADGVKVTPEVRLAAAKVVMRQLDPEVLLLALGLAVDPLRVPKPPKSISASMRVVRKRPARPRKVMPPCPQCGKPKNPRTGTCRRTVACGRRAR